MKHELKVYLDGGIWRLDDREHGLREEPLLFGISAMLNHLTATISSSGRARSLRLQVSDKEFAGYQTVLERGEADAGGYWYLSPSYGLRGWLGGAGLNRYFPEAPMRLFIAAESPKGDQREIESDGHNPEVARLTQSEL